MTALLDTSKVIVGASGSGKTVTAKAEVEQLLGQRRHVLVLDPTGVWWGMRSNPAGDGPGFDLPIFGGEHGDVPIRADQGAAIARIVIEQRVSAIVDLSGIDNSRDWRRFARDLVAELRRKPQGNFHFIVDEADEFAAERPADDVGFALRENMVWMAKRGRVAGFVPTFITQRTAEIAKAVISQAQTIIVHQLIAPSDRKAIDDYLKGHGTAEARAEVMGSLAELGVGERWVYSPRLKILERGRTPPLTTFDSSRTPAPGEQLVEPRGLGALDVSAITAALAPAEPERQNSGYTDDTITADAGEAYAKGSVVGEMLAARDRRIAELEAIVADQRAELEHLRGVDEECDGYNTGLTAIEQLVVAVRSGAWRPSETASQAKAGDETKGQTAPEAEPVSRLAGVRTPAAASEIMDATAGETAPVPPPTLPAGGAGSLSPAVAPRLQAILDWTHWSTVMFGDGPLRRDLLAQLLGRHVRTKGFLNDLGELRSAGLIGYAEGGGIKLTTAGWALAKPVEMPATPQALREHLTGKLLTPAQRRLFAPVVTTWPKGVAREALAEAVGHHPRTKSFLNDLGRLRSLGLVTYDDGVRAADFLMRREG